MRPARPGCDGTTVVRASAAPTGNGMARVEQRGRTTLIWRPLPVTDDWKELLGDAL